MKVILLFLSLFLPTLSLLDHLLWDYCKKARLAPESKTIDIEELEIDPFPFLKGHSTQFNLVRIIEIHMKRAEYKKLRTLQRKEPKFIMPKSRF